MSNIDKLLRFVVETLPIYMGELKSTTATTAHNTAISCGNVGLPYEVGRRLKDKMNVFFHCFIINLYTPNYCWDQELAPMIVAIWLLELL